MAEKQMFIDDEGPAQPITPASLLAHLEAVRDSSGSEILFTPMVAIHKDTLSAIITVLNGHCHRSST